MIEDISPEIASHLRNIARDVAYTGGHASVMRAAASRIESLEDRLARLRALHHVTVPHQYGAACPTCAVTYPCATIRALEGATDD